MEEEFKLSAEQLDAGNSALDYLQNKVGYWACAGLAGTGKSTLTVRLALQLKDDGYNPIILTPTGKSAAVVKRKMPPGSNILCNTIHSALTQMVFNRTSPAGKRLIELDRKKATEGLTKEEEKEENALLVIAQKIEKSGNHLQFEPRTPDNFLMTYGSNCVVMFDEASMIGVKLYDLLIKDHHVPKLFFGDHGQLGPINKDGDDHAAITLESADARLEEILRQKADSGILAISHHVYHQGDYPLLRKIYTHKDITYHDGWTGALLDPLVRTGHQIICWTNATRHRIAPIVRYARGFSPHPKYVWLPRAGERLMLDSGGKTDKGLPAPGLWKGSVVELTEDATEPDEASTNPYVSEIKCFDVDTLRQYTLRISVADLVDGKVFENAVYLRKSNDYATKRRLAETFNTKVQWDGVCTAHKAQGSEWDNVVYIGEIPHDPTPGSTWRRHVYTGITRARNNLVLIDKTLAYRQNPPPLLGGGHR